MREYKKKPSYKPVFEFKTKLHAQMRTHHASLIPPFMVADQAVKVKENADDIFGSCWAVIIVKYHPDAISLGWLMKLFVQCSGHGSIVHP